MSRWLFLLAVVCLADPLAAPQVNNEPLVSALSLFKQGKFQEAATAYRAILTKDSSSAGAHAGLVQSYLKADDLPAAESASAQALAALPQSAPVHAVRGDVYFRKGLLRDAQTEYETALNLDSNCARAWLGMGKIHSAVSLNQYAREFFSKAHELDPDDGDALYHWAVQLPYPQSVNELEKHLSQYRSTPREERHEREFINLVKGIGEREVWVGPAAPPATDIKLDLLSPRPGTTLGLGVHVKFNESTAATLLLDTGSSWMTIPRKLAEKIGARKISDYAIEGVGDSGPTAGYFAWVDKVTIGPVEFHDCVAHVTMKNDNAGDDGILGTDIFSKFLLTLDVHQRKLRLDSLPKAYLFAAGVRNHPIADQMDEKAFQFGHLLLLPTRVNHSITALFVLDTGANFSSITPQAVKQESNLHESDKRVSGVSGDVNKVSRFDDALMEFAGAPPSRRDLLVFDRHSLSQQLGTEVSGFIGYDTLSRMKISINYQSGWVKVEESK